jgi:hypothetical protein
MKVKILAWLSVLLLAVANVFAFDANDYHAFLSAGLVLGIVALLLWMDIDDIR